MFLMEIMGFGEDRIEYVTDRPGHDRRYAIDSSKILKLGWKIEYTKEKFRQGLTETIEWYKNNEVWVKNLLQKKENEMNSFQKDLNRSQATMPPENK